ncbi:MAG: hypothetical protein AAB818_01570 [Patescibacteria group bacterium]
MQECIKDNALLLNEEDGFTEDITEEDDEAEVSDDDDEEAVEETASWKN